MGLLKRLHDRVTADSEADSAPESPYVIERNRLTGRYRQRKVET